jgi:hypothetical protein
MRLPRTSLVARVLLLCAVAGGAACASQLGLDATGANASGGGYGAVATSSGAGGTIIHDGEGGEGGQTMEEALRCGSGCVPGLAEPVPCVLEPGEGGAGGEGGATGSGGAGGAAAEGTCQLAAVDGIVQGVCGVAGTATDGAPCLSSQDCAPGHGCVDPGVCRAYCCGDPEACPAGTHCTGEPLSLLGVKSSEIPVCSPTKPCMLLDDATCSDGETCTIVRADGTTSCVEPGDGKDGEGCPCAAGYVCSFADDRCLRLCRTDRSEDCPAGYQCSGGSKPYPAGYGVCIEL